MTLKMKRGFFLCVFYFSAVHAVGWAEAWCALRCCHRRPRSFLLFALRLYHKLFSPLRLQANLTCMGNTELTPPTSPTISPPKSPTGYVSVPPFPCPLPPPVLSAYLSRFLPSFLPYLFLDPLPRPTPASLQVSQLVTVPQRASTVLWGRSVPPLPPPGGVAAVCSTNDVTVSRCVVQAPSAEDTKIQGRCRRCRRKRE